MANLINAPLDETGNLLSDKSLLRNNPTITFSSSSISSNYDISDVLQINKNALSFRTTLVQNVITNLSANFDFGDALEFTAKRNGVHSFSFYLLQGDINANLPYNVDVQLKVYINGTLVETDVINVDLANGNPFQRLAQSFYANEGDLINFKFRVEKDSVGNPNPNVELYFTGFQANYGNVTDYNLPFNKTTGYKSKVDTSNTQLLTANTDNLISFTGVEYSNGSLNIMDSNGKITPINLGDVLVTDFVFTFPSPSGTTDFLSVKLKVNGFIYCAQSFQILEPTGETNYVAVSFTLPVEADFLQYGAEFFINPNVAITISNRYLQVTRVHKAV